MEAVQVHLPEVMIVKMGRKFFSFLILGYTISALVTTFLLFLQELIRLGIGQSWSNLFASSSALALSYSVFLILILLPCLALKRLPKPADRIAYIPAALLSSFPFLISLSEQISFREIYWDFLTLSISGIFVSISILVFSEKFFLRKR